MKVCNQVLLYAQQELVGAEKAAFEAHLPACAACRAELAFLQRAEEALIPPAAPAAVVEHLFAKTSRKKSFFAVWKPALVSTALLGVGITLFLGGLHPDKTAFDANEVIAYMSENLDEDYRLFAEDLSVFEEEF